ncbi:hypothetical protein [Nocardioides sp. LHG3406-4]|uniref:hypothetical protein n=1 Tax=Nocardioides sp. LHG3406-4 TaxID=2804575 RepID=UPI003CFA801A
MLARSANGDPFVDIEMFNHRVGAWRVGQWVEAGSVVFTGDWTPVLEVEVEVKEVILSVKTGVKPTWREPLEGWSTHRPFSLPPGLERRERMEARGMNISANDFTEAEQAEMEAETERWAATRESRMRPIADLYRD